MKNLINLIIFVLLFSQTTSAQAGEIRGIVSSTNPKEVVPFASVCLMHDSTPIISTAADIGGNYTLKPIPPGKYSIKATCVGFQPELIKGISVTANKTTIVNINLTKGVDLKEMLVEYSLPLIESGSPSQKKTISYEEIQAMPTRTINSSSIQSGVVYQREDKAINIRGSRGDAAEYYVDGVKVGKHGNPRPEDHEDYDLINENIFYNVKRNPLSTFSIDVDAASYSNIRRFITQGTLPPKDAVRIEEMINYFSYKYPQPADNTPFSISTEVSECPWNTKHRLVRIGLNGKEIATENLPKSNLVFLIDVSGSMEDYNKLPLLKNSFHLLVEQLREKDLVSIVVYAGNAGLVLPPTPGNEKEKILRAIDGLEAGGSTAGGAGILLAYKIARENFLKDGNNRVILATDGDFNVGVASDAELTRLIEEKRESGIFLTVLGFGTGNYKDSKMEKLADKGNGNFAYIDNIIEAKKVLVKEIGATLNTIAKDVKLQIEFNPLKVKAYRLIGYENRMLKDRDFNDDKKDAGELGSGCTVTALYEIVPSRSNEELDDIDTLKYQKVKTVATSGSNELMTVKFRYKEPTGSTSKLIVHPLIDEQVAFNNTSEDFRFAAAVAAFGLILRDSKFKGNAKYKSVLVLANNSKGDDVEGYRSEFIRLVETAELLANETTNKK